MSRTHIPRALREKVANQARHRCGYCLTSEMIVGTRMEVDHIVPEPLGGKTEEENLWLACSSCNDHKNDRIMALDTEINETVNLFNPRCQVWSEHFAWSSNGSQILGLTPQGRATVLALNMNRPLLVRARELWVASARRLMSYHESGNHLHWQ